jgi:hypothetical protein
MNETETAFCEVCDDPAVVQGLYDNAATGMFRWVPLCQDCAAVWYDGEEVDHLFRPLEMTP